MTIKYVKNGNGKIAVKKNSASKPIHWTNKKQNPNLIDQGLLIQKRLKRLYSLPIKNSIVRCFLRNLLKFLI